MRPPRTVDTDQHWDYWLPVTVARRGRPAGPGGNLNLNRDIRIGTVTRVTEPGRRPQRPGRPTVTLATQIAHSACGH